MILLNDSKCSISSVSPSSVSPIKLCNGSSSLHLSLHSVAHYQVKESEPFLNKKHKRKTRRSNSPPVTVRNKLIPNVYPMLSTYSRTHLDRSEGSVEARMILQSGQWGKSILLKNKTLGPGL